MSDESYRILSCDEAEAYRNEDWFFKESKSVVGFGWAIPEKRLLKELDKKGFYRQKLQELIDEFEFWKVENIMEVLEWTWAGIVGYPRKDDMIEVVKSLYDSIENRILKEEYSKPCFFEAFSKNIIPKQIHFCPLFVAISVKKLYFCSRKY
jgi:hypothetical protein